MVGPNTYNALGVKKRYVNKTSQHIRDEIVETRREGFSYGHNKWRISRREIYILTQLLLDYRQLPILYINALKEESKIGISASKRNDRSTERKIVDWAWCISRGFETRT